MVEDLVIGGLIEGGGVSRGIIYVMTTVVPGLIKIGKTGSDNFKQRMYSLERNGYFNVAGLKRRFAIEVDDYDEKEELLDEIFSKSRVPGSELFALDVDLVVQLLSSLEGRQVYPEQETKEEVFERALQDRFLKEDCLSAVPNGTYYLKESCKNGNAEAIMEVREGRFTVKAGSRCAPPKHGIWVPEVLRTAPIVNGELKEDVPCRSLSTAGWVVLGRSNNGWRVWKTADGKPLDEFRA